MLSITVSDEDTPTQGPAPFRRGRNAAREKYDAFRKPQAACMYRALMRSHEVGLSWKECWALGEGNEGWDVGPIVVWMRSKGVDIEARYDAVLLETRFFLVGVRGGG